MIPNTPIISVTPASTILCEGPSLPELLVAITKPHTRPSGRRTFCPPATLVEIRSVGGGEEACFLHQRLVSLFFVFHPLGVVGTGHEGGVECTALHQILPFRRLTHLLEQIDIVIDLLL